MTEDLERRLRRGLGGATLPPAPEALRAVLDQLPETARPVGAGRRASRRVAGALAAVAVVVVVALLAVWLPGSRLGPAAPSASPTASPASPTASPSSTPTAVPSPSSPPSPSSTATSMAERLLTIPLDARHSMVLLISDTSGELVRARAATATELLDPSRPVGDAVAYNQGGVPGTQVRLDWGGVICDTSARLQIGPDLRDWLLADGPRPPCDASNSDRGVVLTFARPLDAGTIVLQHEEAAATSADLVEAGLIDALHGWAVAGGRLLITADGGSTWSDVTPAGGFGTGLGYPTGVVLLDGRHGWVAVNEAFASATDPGYGRIDIWRTGDGGQSWAKTELPRAVLNPFGEILPDVQLDFVDAAHGVAFLSGNAAKGANDSDLFVTADGGATWSADRPTGLGSAGLEGTVAFATASDGVIVGTDEGSGIAVTHDGGRTWSDALLTPSPRSAGVDLFFDRPVFGGGKGGLVAVDVQTDAGSVTHVYRTADLGASWTDVATLPPGFTAVSLVDAQHWVVFDGTSVRRTDDGGATWTQAAAPSPTMAFGWPQFVDGMDGWWLEGPSGAAWLYATHDGGVTWQRLVTP